VFVLSAQRVGQDAAWDEIERRLICHRSQYAHIMCYCVNYMTPTVLQGNFYRYYQAIYYFIISYHSRS